eukprot:11088911-Ditylum_brightwellii.AAC.1
MMPNINELVIGRLRLKIYDLGGHETARLLWDDYVTNADAVVFLVDAFDRSRFPEAKKELDGLLACEGMEGVPFLILGNKIDMPSAASEDELRYYLGLDDTYGKYDVSARKGDGAHGRHIEVFMCSVLRRMGFKEGFEWLSQVMD